MDRDILRVLKLRRQGAIGRPSGRRIAMICLVALLATGVWWVILHFGGRAVGYPIGDTLLFTVLAGIFLLLVLGLSMAAMATSGTPKAHRGVRQDGVAEPPPPRRKVG
jgi:hypothetical protein